MAPGGSTSDSDDMQLLQRLLHIPLQCQAVGQPEKALHECACLLGETLNLHVSINWAADGPYPGPPAEGSVTLEVFNEEEPFALIRLHGSLPDSEALRFGLQHLAHDFSQAVTTGMVRQTRRAVEALREAIAANESEVALISVALEHFGAEAGALLVQHAPGRGAYALAGDWPGDPALGGRYAQVIENGMADIEPRLHEGGLLTIPLSATRPVRSLLLVRFASESLARRVPLGRAAELAGVAAPFVAGRWRDRVLTELLELNRASGETTSEELYASMLRTAVSLVPGADSGSLLTRSHAGQPFRYEAAAGFDLELLRRYQISEHSTRAWYGGDADGWEQGRPRILRRDEIDITEHGGVTAEGFDPAATTYDVICSTLCLPVWRDGHVMAILNLDNRTDPGAFAQDSLRLASLFGSPLASLLHRHQTRELLHRAALTDDLTGLANRRAFEDVLVTEHARSLRSGLPFSLLMLDMTDFKVINDSFGHEAGDQALQTVGQTLLENIRTGDFAGRYGGDEFVVILHDSTPERATAVAERIRSAVRNSGQPQETGELDINIGIVTFGHDGVDLQDLRRLADERMYADKHQGRRQPT